MNTIFTVLLIISISKLYGQYTKTERLTNTVVQQRSVYLNGGLRSSTGGKSRVVIPFDLPKNTIEWFYSFSTSKGTSGIKNLNLAIQISSYLVDQSGVVSTFMDQAKVPSGSSSIDVYLLNSDNKTGFVEKWDLNGGKYYYIPEGTTENTKQAVVKVDDVRSGRWYLGLKNPSSLDGVNIYIEVTAVIENKVYVDEWTNESQNKLKSKCLENFNTETSGKNEVCDCLLDKITNQNLPSEWNNQSNISQQTIINSELNNCFNETNSIALKNAEEKYHTRIRIEKEELEKSFNNVNNIIKEAQAASTIGDYSEAREKMLSATNLILNNQKLKNLYGSKWIANSFNSAAWYSILLSEIKQAGEYLKNGFKHDTQNMYLRGNLGLFHLLSGNYREAEKSFLHYKRKQKFPDKRKWVDVIKEDLNLLESKGMGNPDFNKIKKLLKIR